MACTRHLTNKAPPGEPPGPKFTVPNPAETLGQGRLVQTVSLLI